MKIKVWGTCLLDDVNIKCHIRYKLKLKLKITLSRSLQIRITFNDRYSFEKKERKKYTQITHTKPAQKIIQKMRRIY